MFEAILLGLIQGLTEFLPVSSSGHLIVAREFLGLPLENTLAFDVLLHLATLFAIIVCFWGDLKRILVDLQTEGLSARSSRLVWAIVLGSIPAVFFGFFFGEEIENVFRDPRLVAYALILGSLLFLLADSIQKLLPRFYTSGKGISPARGFFIGVFQSLSLISGFSRSGSTISGGLVLGLSREESIRFAFLLGIPVIAGAAFKTFLDLGSSGLSHFLSPNYILGFIAALLSGLWAVRFLVRYLSKNSFTVFIIYRLLLAGLILFLL